MEKEHNHYINLISHMGKLIAKIARPLALVLMAIMVITPADAVLKERSLSKTLNVLCAELEENYKQQKVFMASADKRTQKRRNELVSLMKRSQQVSLMLYSLPSDYIFDISYACEQATSLYDEFTRDMEDSETSYNVSRRLFEEVNRYDALIRALESLPPAFNKKNMAIESVAVNDSVATPDSCAVEDDDISVITQELKQEQPYKLSEKEQKIRERCIVYAMALRNNYVRLYNRAKADERHYKDVATSLGELNEYALKQYERLQQSLTETSGDDYIKVLTTLPSQVTTCVNKIKDKYLSLSAESDWRGPVLLFVSISIIFYMALASSLSYLLIVLLPKMNNRVGRKIRKQKVYQEKKVMISYALGVAIFAVALGLVKIIAPNNHLLIMATSFMYIFAWLFFVIILSITIRHSGDKMRHGLASYLPFMLMACFVIIMRIVFMPVSLINLIFPPIMLGFTIWQIYNLRKHRKYLATSDMAFSYITLALMIIATVLTLLGYTLTAVESMVWWSFQLAFIQTVECIRVIADNYEKTTFMQRLRKKENIPSSTTDAQLLAQMRKGDYVGDTWFIDLIRIAVIPFLAIFSVLASMYCEADFFNCANQCRAYFGVNFVDVPDTIQISLRKLYIAGVVFCVFRYVLHVVRSAYRIGKEGHATKHKRPQPNITLANNVMAILVWGFYFIFCLVLFNVPKSGISVISAGLATGLGFAMKDLLENFFYGISLMAGRVRVGDYIECDGTFGHVESITYQSTQITTIDGGTVAFLNKALFSKNFCNLTRTTNYTLVKLPVGVAYGANIEHVRKVIVDHLNAFYEEYKAKHTNLRRPMIKESGFIVAFRDFGDSSVDLFVKYWVLVEHRIVFNALVNEQIYIALTNAGIEIPFPQRDIHIIKPAE